MKRIVAIVFSMFYLVLSFGLSLNFHFCGGKLESIELFADKTTCCCGNVHEQSSCCKNNTYLYQLNDEQKTSEDIRVSDLQSFKIIEQAILSPFIISEVNANELKYNVKDKPPPKKQPTWLINCSLTYYA